MVICDSSVFKGDKVGEYVCEGMCVGDDGDDGDGGDGGDARFKSLFVTSFVVCLCVFVLCVCFVLVVCRCLIFLINDLIFCLNVVSDVM